MFLVIASMGWGSVNAKSAEGKNCIKTANQVKENALRIVENCPGTLYIKTWNDGDCTYTKCYQSSGTFNYVASTMGCNSRRVEVYSVGGGPGIFASFVGDTVRVRGNNRGKVGLDCTAQR
jgi:hypothetical protein